MEDPTTTAANRKGVKRVVSIIAGAIILSAVAIMTAGRCNGDKGTEGGGEILLGIGCLVGVIANYFIK